MKITHPRAAGTYIQCTVVMSRLRTFTSVNPPANQKLCAYFKNLKIQFSYHFTDSIFLLKVLLGPRKWFDSFFLVRYDFLVRGRGKFSLLGQPFPSFTPAGQRKCSTTSVRPGLSSGIWERASGQTGRDSGCFSTKGWCLRCLSDSAPSPPEPRSSVVYPDGYLPLLLRLLCHHSMRGERFMNYAPIYCCGLFFSICPIPPGAAY